MTASKNIGSLIGGAAILAAAAIGLAQPAVSHAEREWDIGVYDDCIQSGLTIQTCCALSGGDYDPEGITCYAPAAVQTTPEPLPPRINTGSLPTVATNAPATTVPGGRAPGGLPSGGVATP
jgi:hypothetical protein